LRQHDIRQLQHELAELGLSRLGRVESHTISSINVVLNALHALAGLPHSEDASTEPKIKQGRTRLAAHTEAIFGSSAATFRTRIMVTMPSEAATDPILIHDLLASGMQVMRINCEHDDIDAWLSMIGHLRQAEKALGKSCKVFADLAGPKLRTGAIKPLGRLVEFKIKRDSWGREIAPAFVWLTPASQPETPRLTADAILPIEDSVLALAHANDTLDVDDTRGSRRHLILLERSGNSWLAKCHRHAFIDDSARCKLYRQENLIAEGALGELPEVLLPITLKIGDTLQLVKSAKLGRPAIKDEDDHLLQPARIPCSLDSVFGAVEFGQSIWFDDGKIGGTIKAIQPEVIEVLINQAAPQGSKLYSERGINLPDTNLPISGLTDIDSQNLQALAECIDIVGLSFVRDEKDVQALHQKLHDLNATHLGCVLKIETRLGFDNLPHILLAGMQHPPLAVMVARGDLAVEVGYERLSEVQDEILCLCEAAHVPVIWATQVLENMTKRGVPSRAEVSDAALAIRAECVMLNKGAHIIPTIEFLQGVLQRMNGHHEKQHPAMSRLSVSDLRNDAQ
jgi:pyruvate kinase